MSDPLTTESKRGLVAHSQGPWYIETHGNWIWVAIPHAVGRKVLARLETGFNEPFESEQHANARLIAAAPEMLELLKKYGYDGHLQSFEDRERFRKDALAIIAKAEGKL